MKTHILNGSKAEIAENVARIDGVIREVIVFVEEMAPYMVSVGGADYSRESIYTRMEGE